MGRHWAEVLIKCSKPINVNQFIEKLEKKYTTTIAKNIAIRTNQRLRTFWGTRESRERLIDSTIFATSQDYNCSIIFLVYENQRVKCGIEIADPGNLGKILKESKDVALDIFQILAQLKTKPSLPQINVGFGKGKCIVKCKHKSYWNEFWEIFNPSIWTSLILIAANTTKDIITNRIGWDTFWVDILIVLLITIYFLIGASIRLGKKKIMYYEEQYEE
jgi:hypothetical protein